MLGSTLYAIIFSIIAIFHQWVAIIFTRWFFWCILSYLWHSNFERFFVGMIVKNRVIFPFLVHKDALIRERVSYHVRKVLPTLKASEKKEVIKNAFLSFDSFGLEDNQPILSLLSLFRLNFTQLRSLCLQFEKLHMNKKDEKFYFFPVGSESRKNQNIKNQIEKCIEKILLNQPVQKMQFLLHHFSNDFWEYYFENMRRGKILDELKRYYKTREENEIWAFAKEKYCNSSNHPSKKEEGFYFKLMMDIIKKRFSGEYHIEMESFFTGLQVQMKGQKSKRQTVKCSQETKNHLTWYLAVVSSLFLRNHTHQILDLMAYSWPKAILLQMAKTLAVFRDDGISRNIRDLFFDKPTDVQKSVYLFYFSRVNNQVSEQCLLEISKKNHGFLRKIEIARAFSAIFSSNFLPFALSIYKDANTHRFDLEEEIIIFSSILGSEDDNFPVFAKEYFEKRSGTNYRGKASFFVNETF